jgi:hypothetical protein
MLFDQCLRVSFFKFYKGFFGEDSFGSKYISILSPYNKFE